MTKSKKKPKTKKSDSTNLIGSSIEGELLQYFYDHQAGVDGLLQKAYEQAAAEIIRTLPQSMARVTALRCLVDSAEAAHRAGRLRLAHPNNEIPTQEEIADYVNWRCNRLLERMDAPSEQFVHVETKVGDKAIAYVKPKKGG